MSYDEDYLYALQLQNELNAFDENEALAEVSTFSYIRIKIALYKKNTCEMNGFDCLVPN